MGRTALMWAATRNDHAAVELLLSYRGDVSQKDIYGLTALHLPARWGSQECADRLLAAGADPMIEGWVGQTPLYEASRIRSRKISERIIRALQSYGADVNTRSDNGWTPLMQAAWDGNAPGIEILANTGGNINAIGDYGLPPVSIAILNGSYDSLKVLWKLGVSLFWPHELPFPYKNLFQFTAVFGSVDAMDLLAVSDCPPGDYIPDQVMYMFNQLRGAYGIRDERLPIDEELAAFQNLFVKKGTILGPAKKGLETIEDTPQDYESNGDEGSDEGTSENFEDAIEDLSNLAKPESSTNKCTSAVGVVG